MYRSLHFASPFRANPKRLERRHEPGALNAVDTKPLFLIWFRVGGMARCSLNAFMQGRTYGPDKGACRIAGMMDTIELDKVNVTDSRFCVSYPLADDLLLASIKRFGILTPIALQGGERPAVITGHKRCDAARVLGIAHVPCVFFDAGDRQALLMSINDNMARPLNTVERAVCVAKMAALGFPTEEVYAVMAMLGLPARENVLKTCIEAASAEEQVSAFIVGHGLPVAVVEQLFGFETGEMRDIIRLVGPLHPTVSSLREALHLMMLARVKLGGIDFAGLDEARDMEA